MRIQGKKKKGFTLIELIIVFAILAIIAAIAIPNFTAMRKKSTVKADVETAKQIINAVDTLVTEGEISVDAAITNLSVTADGTTGDGATIVKYLKGKIPEVQSAAKDTRFILNVDAGGLNTTVTFKPVPKPSKVPDGTTMDTNGTVYVK